MMHETGGYVTIDMRTYDGYGNEGVKQWMMATHCTLFVYVACIALYRKTWHHRVNSIVVAQ